MIAANDGSTDPASTCKDSNWKAQFRRSNGKDLVYNLKGTSYGQSVLHFYALLGKGLLKFLTKYLQYCCFSISLHFFVKVHRPVARFKGLGQKQTFLGGHGFVIFFKQFF